MKLIAVFTLFFSLSSFSQDDYRYSAYCESTDPVSWNNRSAYFITSDFLVRSIQEAEYVCNLFAQDHKINVTHIYAGAYTYQSEAQEAIGELWRMAKRSYGEPEFYRWRGIPTWLFLVK